MGGTLPVVGALSEAANADTLLLGIAPPGGKIPPAWRAIVLEAISRGMNIWAGLHEFLSADPEFSAAAAKHGVQAAALRL